MSSNAPDFSTAFDVVDNNLAETEKRLNERRHKLQKKKEPSSVPQESDRNKEEVRVSDQNTNRPPTATANQPQPKDRKVLAVQLVPKEIRRNITLKVLEENEVKFNQLFHKLQLRGDARKKQDLADEALNLLFAKYKQLD